MSRETIGSLAAADRTTLLVVDVQNDFCHPDGHFGRHGRDLGIVRGMIPNLVRLVASAREAGVPVVWIVQTTEAGGASDSPAWLRYKTRDGKAPDYTLRGTWGREVVDELQPRDDEVRVTKYRSDAFLDTSLDLVLRASGRDTVLITGVNTEGCVDATLRSTSFHDYFAILVDDCVGSFHAEHHAAALSIMRSRHDVATHGELSDSWARSGVAAAPASSSS